MIPSDHRNPFPVETIRPNEQVYIVDFFIDPEKMRQLLSITADVTWIDHHKTAIEMYEDFEQPIRGIRANGIAGCVLTYIYLHELTQKGEGPIKPFEPSMLERVPWFTRLIGDRDVREWKFGERTKHFYAGLQLRDTGPTSDVWIEALQSTELFERDGKLIERFKRVMRKEYIRSFAFETELEGYSAIACNLGRKSSELFESIEEPYDLKIAFVFDGQQYTVILFSTTVDVSEIAKKYGGAGHREGAGFMCKTLPFVMKEPVWGR